MTQAFNDDNTVRTLTDTAGSSTVASNTYTYDDNSQILTQALGGSIGSYTNTYAYNPAGNITSWGDGTSTATYTWDHNSNRRTITSSGVTATTTYNSDNTVNTSQGGSSGPVITSTYTPAGELYKTTTNSGADVCTQDFYDAFQRTAKQQTFVDNACNTTKASTATNTYDGLDRIQTTTLTGSQTANTQDSYDGLTSELVGQTGAVTANNSNPTVLYQLNPNGAPVAFSQTTSGTSATTWLNKDATGNVTSLQNLGTTTSSCSVEYDPFGNPQKTNAPPSGNNVCMTGGNANATTGNTLWFQAGNRSSSGTYQFGSRTYDPSTAAFTTPDTYRTGTPAQDLSVGVDPLTANTYTYVNGNPVNLSDPDGHRAIDADGNELAPCVSNPNGPGCTPQVTAQAQASYHARLHSEAVGRAEATRQEAAVRLFDRAHSAWASIRTNYFQVGRDDCGNDPTTCRLALWYDHWVNGLYAHSAAVGMDALNPLEQSAVGELRHYNDSAAGAVTEDGTVQLIITMVATLGVSGTYSLLRGTAAAAISALGGGAVRESADLGLTELGDDLAENSVRSVADQARGAARELRAAGEEAPHTPTPIAGGRADAETVFAGHGAESPLFGTTTIPEGTTLKVYSASFTTISDSEGLAIENGTSALNPVRVFGPGESAPNLLLGAPTGLQTMSESVTVAEDTLLSDLLRPNMGVCHWAACTEGIS